MAKFVRTSSLIFCVLIYIYYEVAKRIFEQVNKTSKVIVDEMFHLPLGHAYCNYEFDKWDPKVTTLPGLYLISSLLLGPWNLCSIYWLRFISFGASILNMCLYFMVLNMYNGENRWKNIVASLNLTLLPPLYLFSNFYYTDVISVTVVLLLMYFSKKRNHYFASISGMLSVIVRQTNIIFVGMMFLDFVMEELNKHTKAKPHNLSIVSLNRFIKDLIQAGIKMLKKSNLFFWLDAFCYCSVIITFIMFVIWNGSIVVGDKSAHEATIHVPQLFYFSLFCLFFSWPYFVREIKNFIFFALRHKLTLLFVTVTCMLIVHFNTLVHPYLLADNRHYMFYIWNRFYGNYIWFKYFMVPVYIFSLYVIVTKFSYNSLVYVPCIMFVLIPQKLMDVRYYFIPYILFRVHIKRSPRWCLLCEFVTFVAVNIVTFYLFFNKTIHWVDFDEPQRLIW